MSLRKIIFTVVTNFMDPLKLLIKYVLNLHLFGLKNAIQALDMVLFLCFGAIVAH